MYPWIPPRLHLGAFVVGQVALERLPLLARFVVILLQPFPDLLGFLLQRFHVLLFLGLGFHAGFAGVHLPMPPDDLSDNFLHLLFLMLQLLFGPAPFLRGVRRHLAAIHREHLFTDQPHRITDHQHFQKEMDYLPVQAGNKSGDGGEVGPGVSRQRHEDNFLVAALGDLPAGSNPSGLGIQNDLQQDGWIIRAGAPVSSLLYRPSNIERSISWSMR